MLAQKLVTQGITSFADPRTVEFKAELRKRLAPIIPAGWEAVKDFEYDVPAAIEVRRQWDRARFEAGLACVGWPEEFGGNGFNSVEMALYGDVCGELEAPHVFNMLGYGLAGTAIINWGNESQQRRFLPRILDCTDTWCEGFSEPGGGADMANYQTTATKVPGGWHIQGSKIWTTNSPWGDRLYLLARSSLEAAKRHNLTVFLLDLHAPGVSVQPIRQITGTTSFGQVFIDTDVKDEDDIVLGEVGEGWSLASLVGKQRPANKPRPTGAGAGGSTQRLVRNLRRCALEVGSAAARDQVEEMLIRYEGHEWQGRRLIELGMNGRELAKASSVTKIDHSEMVQAITGCGVDLHCPKHDEYWREKHLDSRKHSIAGAPNEVYRNMIANRILGMGR